MSHPPYEVSELGWGEFTVQIIITFVDAIQEDPLTLQHHLRLFGEGATPAGPLIFEKYDEAVFVSPTPQALAVLKEPPSRMLPETSLTPFCTSLVHFCNMSTSTSNGLYYLPTTFDLST